MKKYILINLVLLYLCQYGYGQNYKDDADEAKDTKYECFVQQNDSVIIKFHEVKFKLAPLTFGILKGDGERLKYAPGDLIAFQDDRGYWLRIAKSGIKPFESNISFEDLYALRLKKGKIELFIQRNDKLLVDGKLALKGDKYFIRKGNQIQFIDNKAVLKEAVKDKKKVYDSFDETYGKGKRENIYDVIDAYNTAR